MRRKDEEREEARRLRAEGMSIRAIAKQLGVAFSSVSVWVRDIPGPPRPVRQKRPPGRPTTPEAPHDPAEPLRSCSRCDRDLPESRFNRAGTGRQWWCRDCFKEYQRARGRKHIEQSQAAKVRRKALAREWVTEHLRRHPCVDCGESEMLVLEFDHCRGEKLAAVSKLVAQAAGLEKLAAEVDKCDIVCANCHRRRTASRAGHFRLTGIPPASWSAPQRRNAMRLLDELRRTGCVDCGEADPVVLDFDHRRDKRGQVTRIALRCGLAVLEAEIAKCDVRCANCHRIRTVTSGGFPVARDHWALGLHDDAAA